MAPSEALGDLSDRPAHCNATGNLFAFLELSAATAVNQIRDVTMAHLPHLVRLEGVALIGRIRPSVLDVEIYRADYAIGALNGGLYGAPSMRASAAICLMLSPSARRGCREAMRTVAPDFARHLHDAAAKKASPPKHSYAAHYPIYPMIRGDALLIDPSSAARIASAASAGEPPLSIWCEITSIKICAAGPTVCHSFIA